MNQEQTRESLKAAPSGVRPNGGDRSGADLSENAPSVSVMGPDILVTGNIEASIDLHIEGRVNGDVRCATLILGAASVVTGSIWAERVRVSGTVEGAIETRDLAIEAAARVKGDVSYSRIRIASGGVIEGTLTHKPAPVEESLGDAKLKLVDVPPVEQKVHYFE